MPHFRRESRIWNFRLGSLLKPVAMSFVHTVDECRGNARISSLPASAMTSTNPSGHRVLADGSALGQLIEQFDWSATPLGEINSWSGPLKTTIGLISAIAGTDRDALGRTGHHDL